MDTKTKVIIIIASVAGIGISAGVIYYLVKPTPPPPITTTTTTSTGSASTSTGGLLTPLLGGAGSILTGIANLDKANNS